MAKRSKIAQQVYDISLPVAKQLGFDLVDVEYKKDGPSMFLRIFIDKPGGLLIDDCEQFSKVIDPVIDEQVKHDADFFEVSSPGLTRALQGMEDFNRYKDEYIEISLFKEVDGVKNFLAQVKSSTDDELIVGVMEDKSINKAIKKYVEVKELKLSYSQISKAIRHIEF